MDLVNRRGEKIDLDLWSSDAPTKQSVIDRIKPTLEKAAIERTGIFVFLTDAEMQAFSEADLDSLMEETGYSAMCRSVQQPPPLPL